MPERIRRSLGEASVACDPERIRNAEIILDEIVQSGQLPSAVAALAHRDGVVWSYVIPGSDGLDWSSIFLLGSLTKPVVATGIMQLIERGRLLINDPVKDYIPEFEQNGKQHVTIWQLLTHTSGLDEANHSFKLFMRRAPSAAYLKAACEAGLHFEPGTQSKTCNLGYVVLAEIITRISGQSYSHYLHKHIFAPLGMIDTSFAPSAQERVVPVYGFGKAEDMAHYTSLAAPYGGLWSTAADLLLFGQAFLNNGRLGSYRLLSEAAVETMTRVHTAGLDQLLDDGQLVPSYTGIGWGMRSPKGAILGSERSFGHAGKPGTWLWVDPAWDLVFVMLSNRWKHAPHLPMRVLNAVYGALERVPR